MRRLRLLVLAAIIFLPAAEAAQSVKFNQACTSVPRHLWLSLSALQTKVEAQGYKIQTSRLTSTCAAFESLSDDGTHIEVFVDPTNGEVKGRVKL